MAPSTAACCDGLLDGWARRVRNHQPVHAASAGVDEGPFYCAACHQEVVLRCGAERVRHFAHPATMAGGSGEGVLHASCKQEIQAALAAALPDGDWQVERRMSAAVRPDVSGWVRGVPVAIEVQASALGIAEIARRMRVYAQRRIPVLWVVPRATPPADDSIKPQLHERYFHSLYFGRTYYWWPGLGAAVLPIHHGHQAPYRSLKLPYCGPRLLIHQDFEARRRASFSPADPRKALPACQLWLDRLAPWW